MLIIKNPPIRELYVCDAIMKKNREDTAKVVFIG
jgi:hypothetical protein